MYIHQLKQWPKFQWNEEQLKPLLLEVNYLKGKLLGQMGALGFPLQEKAFLQTITEDVIKTSQIEGENLNIEQVRSSIAKRLGIRIEPIINKIERHVDGTVKMTLDAILNCQQPLTKKRLFKWHKWLFPEENNFLYKVNAGKWRSKKSGKMQVVSGPYGREKIHFEAPDHNRLTKEMQLFINWFNEENAINLIIKSAITHFWFVTIHPFDDGNGRIARALGDMVLVLSDNTAQHFYSMSGQIQQERNSYYDILEKSQKGSLDITAWIKWYLNCLKNAILKSEENLYLVLMKGRFWARFAGEYFNERQTKMLNLILDGFNGKLTTSKWAKITKSSQDTALRDISDLVQRNVLEKEEGGGRSTSYRLAAIYNNL